MKDRFWRTILRVTRVNDYEKLVTIVIPGWSGTEEIILSFTKFPEKLRPYLKKDYRFYAHVNIGAEEKKDLQFKDWEWTENETVETQKRIINEFKMKYNM